MLLFLLKKCENLLHCKYAVVFVEKMRESFALQKILTFFQQKNSVFDNVVHIYLTD